MAIDIILAIIAVASLVGAGWILIKKLPVVKMINTTKIGDTKDDEVKTVITEARLKRKFENVFKKIGEISHPLVKLTKKYSSDLSSKVKLWEGELKQKVVQQTEGAKPLLDLLQQADEARAKEDWEMGERLYLEVIRQSPKEIRAYDGLGELYLGAQDWEEAQELYTYLVNNHKTNPYYHVGLGRALSGQGQLELAKNEYLKCVEVGMVSSQIFFELARLYKDLAQIPQAFDAMSQARKMESGNPRILDFFIEISILNGRQTDAQSGLDDLRKANPENKKIALFDKQIIDLVSKTKIKSRGMSPEAEPDKPTFKTKSKQGKKE